MAISNAEVRFWIQDRKPEDNSLAEDLEFTDEEISFAQNSAARAYNDILPTTAIGPRGFSNHSNMWFEAIAQALYKSKLHSMRRNDMEIKGGNVLVDHVGVKIKHLERMVQELEAWRETARQRKIETNLRGFYANIG